jgi:hypothetical protein
VLAGDVILSGSTIYFLLVSEQRLSSLSSFNYLVTEASARGDERGDDGDTAPTYEARLPGMKLNYPELHLLMQAVGRGASHPLHLGQVHLPISLQPWISARPGTDGPHRNPHHPDSPKTIRHFGYVDAQLTTRNEVYHICQQHFGGLNGRQMTTTIQFGRHSVDGGPPVRMESPE